MAKKQPQPVKGKKKAGQKPAKRAVRSPGSKPSNRAIRAKRKSQPQRSTKIRPKSKGAKLTVFWKSLLQRWNSVVTEWRKSFRKTDSSTTLRSIDRKKPLRVEPSRRRQNISMSRSGKSQVRLIGEIEHRCPYCLEVVAKFDPRGLKICPICHTHHHADCWAVTGVCQVPHQYE